MTLKEAEDALRADADMWDRVADVTDLARQYAVGLKLTTAELSFAAAETPLLHTYEEIREKVSVLLGEATTVYRKLSVTLDQVATAYKANDEAAAIKFKGVWDARD